MGEGCDSKYFETHSDRPYLIKFDRYVDGVYGIDKTSKVELSGHGWFMNENEIEIIEEEIKLKFNIGDRVVFTDKYGVIDYGKVGTIVDINEDLACPYLVEFDEHVNGHDGNGYTETSTKGGHGWYVDDLEIDFVEEAEVLDFKIGDRVVVDGEVGTIVDILRGGSPYLVEFDGYVNGHDGNGISEVKTKDGHGWYVGSDEMELLGDNEKYKSIFDDICKRLGVKLNEVWVANNGYKYKITETGIYFYNNNTKEWYEIFAPDYRDVIKGEVYPTEMWVPKVGELVYVISPELHSGTRQILYNGSIEHKRLYERGFIYENEEQARSVASMIVEEFGR